MDDSSSQTARVETVNKNDRIYIAPSRGRLPHGWDHRIEQPRRLGYVLGIVLAIAFYVWFIR